MKMKREESVKRLFKDNGYQEKKYSSQPIPQI
jgi:hypothetical protein